jgi:aquaporin Z
MRMQAATIRWSHMRSLIMATPSLSKRFLAESIGTFWLVFAGIGTAVTAAAFPVVGVGFIGVALAVGLTVLTMAYAVGHISGAHLNPAVTVGLWLGRRFPAQDVLPYIVAQLIGGILGAAGLFVLVAGRVQTPVIPGAPDAVQVAHGALAAASNGYGAHSPGLYSLGACFLAETVLTFMFLLIIMGATDRRAPQGFAPLAIGLGLTLIHLVGIPIDNLSVNPARSTATALFTLGSPNGWALGQLWLFWVAPVLGGALGGLAYHAMSGRESESPAAPLEKLAEQSAARADRTEGRGA